MFDKSMSFYSNNNGLNVKVNNTEEETSKLILVNKLENQK